MRKKISLLLLAVFAIFLGIVIFHLLSHGLHHDETDGHECPICLWLHYAAMIMYFPAVVFCVIFRIVNLIVALPRIPLIKLSLSANISRAPPRAYS